MVHKKVYIDAKWYFSGPVSGVMFTKNLVKHWLARQSNVCLLIRKCDLHLAKIEFSGYLAAGLTFIVLPDVYNLINNLLVLPFKILTLGLSNAVFILQNFTFPNFCFFRRKNIKIVLYVHDILFVDFPEYFTWKERLYFKMITPSLNWSDVVICPSVSERNRIKKFFHKSSDRIFAIPHGVKLEFPSQPKSFVNEKHLPENFILYVGRLNDRKNVANLLSAVKDKLDLKLVIVGKRDWLETSLPEKIESENVTWFKWLTESELTFLYMKASVFCFPSKAEGFGLPVLEAMYFGLPVICGHNTSLAEVGADCVHYVDIDSPEAIYQGIVKVLNDVEYRNHLSQKGLARSREFTWDRTVNEMLRVIQCL